MAGLLMLSLTRPARLWHNSAHPNQVNFRDWSRSLPFCFYPGVACGALRRHENNSHFNSPDRLRRQAW